MFIYLFSHIMQCLDEISTSATKIGFNRSLHIAEVQQDAKKLKVTEGEINVIFKKLT